jgi:hypothetical protein
VLTAGAVNSLARREAQCEVLPKRSKARRAVNESPRGHMSSGVTAVLAGRISSQLVAARRCPSLPVAARHRPQSLAVAGDYRPW